MHLLFTLYYVGVVMFGFVGNAVGYCLLLVFNSLCCIAMIYLFGGSSWYALLMYLVYVGGVYILFIFVSVHLPNNLNNGAMSYLVIGAVFLFFSEVGRFLLLVDFSTPDESHNFCSGYEGVTYLFLCFFLLLGFFLVSFISSSKESFIR